MYAVGTKQNKYVDKFFDLLTNCFISSTPHLFCEHIYTAFICSNANASAFERMSKRYTIDLCGTHTNDEVYGDGEGELYMSANISH